jgi:leucyl-tRNA synthetase
MEKDPKEVQKEKPEKKENKDAGKGAKPAKDEKEKTFARRDKLIANEREAQTLWEQQKFNQAEIQPGRKKFMVTFPFPYMNGLMHLGHAFSLTKAEFFIRFKRLRGFNVLFPFGLHCTGMPICAAAKRLKEEIDNHGIAKLKQTMEENNKLPLDKRPPMSQFEILYKQEISEVEIPKFTDPVYWVHFFPEKAFRDLHSFGINVDWRRSFITTDENPYFDSFIRWHFMKLKQFNFMKFGQRPSIYSIKDKQMCADHDRAEGEGVEPQEYTLIKLKLLEIPKVMEAVQGKNVFLVAATLRPETMYGQTNCYVLPEGNYGVYETKTGDFWVCSEHSARNMAYQDLLKTPEQWEKICDVKGTDLIGLPVKAPLSTYEKVYVIPMLSILMDKGTGIVTSVPSDSPDDFAVLSEFKKKQPLREKFGLKDEMVMPFNPISIIEIPGYSTMSAEKACEEFKVKSMNDKKQLKEAKDKVYTLGFYDGVLLVGPHKGMKVQDAKPLVKADLIKDGHAAVYWEPESEVISRSKDICVVAFTDQWFLPYGNEPYKGLVKQHINGPEFNTFNDNIKEAFNAAVDWFKEWGCSRSFGLGTKFPWDEKYIIESLSDSTIYMAYYTIAHYLQSDLAGRTPGSAGIAATDITEKDWDYIFLNVPYNKDTMKIPEDKAKTMKESFRYWYPLDLRVSGKDLIRNHLTMALYNHAVVWHEEGTKMMPKAFFCNGWVLVDGKKMSKSLGNFYTIKDLCTNFGADASRIALANAGDTLNDANVSLKEIDEAILKLSALEMWIKDKLAAIDTYRVDDKGNEAAAYHDKIFENELNKIVVESCKFYESLVLREVVKRVFFTLHDLREEYFINVGAAGMRRDLVIRYLHIQLSLLYPIAPHFTEITWNKMFVPALGKDKTAFPEYLSHGEIPEVDAKVIDNKLSEEYAFYNNVARSIRTSFDKLTSGKKKKMDADKVKSITIIYNDKYEDWQINLLNYFKDSKTDKDTSKAKWEEWIKGAMEGQDKKKQTAAFEFGSIVIADHAEIGEAAYNTSLGYDQKSVLNKTKDVLLRDIKHIQSFTVLSQPEAEKSENAQIKALAANVKPGNPQILFE